MPPVAPVQKITVPQERIGMQVDDGEAVMKRPRFVRHFDQGQAIDLVHAPLDHRRTKGEEAGNCQQDYRPKTKEDAPLHSDRS